MAVRNFWVNAEIDGRKTSLSGGPASKTGGMEVTIYQRDNGCIEDAVMINCSAYCDELVTEVWVCGKMVGKFESKR